MVLTQFYFYFRTAHEIVVVWSLKQRTTDRCKHSWSRELKLCTFYQHFKFLKHMRSTLTSALNKEKWVWTMDQHFATI